jgi:peptide chain release factor 1
MVMRNDSDAEIAQLGKLEVEQLTTAQEKLMEQIKFLLIPKDPNDDKNIVVEIRGAAGGDEAFIFASDLFRMYTKYCEKNGWKVQMLSDAGGQSTITFMVKGDAVYSKLKFESGAHRVQRVPATEASGRIHTSTATVLVMPEVEEVDIVINSSDLQVDTYRSQGAGGQNVNKTESAIRITHLPTGLVVSCQIEKSQIQNRELAMKMLYAKLEAHKQAEIDEKVGNERKLKVGTGERSEKIRTYNYPQNRVTDHRIGFTINQLDRVMEGQIDNILEALNHFDQQQKLTGGE